MEGERCLRLPHPVSRLTTAYLGLYLSVRLVPMTVFYPLITREAERWGGILSLPLGSGNHNLEKLSYIQSHSYFQNKRKTMDSDS